MTYEAVAAVAEGCDVVVATGLIGAAAGAQAAAEKLGIPYRCASFSPCFLPSPHQRPVPWPGQVLPADETDNHVLWDLNARHLQKLFGGVINTHRASIGLAPTDNIRDHVFTDQPFLAADPVLGPWPQPAYLDVVQTGAWIRPDERSLPAGLEAFLDAGTPPVYAGFGSMPLPEAEQVAGAVTEAVRAQGRRVLLGAAGPTSRWSTTGTTASSSARSTSRRCFAGWPPPCTTAARARPRRPPRPARPR